MRKMFPTEKHSWKKQDLTGIRATCRTKQGEQRYDKKAETIYGGRTGKRHYG